MNEIKCPHDLNQFLLGEPIFENPFPKEECEQRKFYGDCYHCFSTAIASRDHQLKEPKTAHWIELDECSNSGYYCSECRKKVVKEGWSETVKKIKFCPNCGVPLEGVKYC